MKQHAPMARPLRLLLICLLLELAFANPSQADQPKPGPPNVILIMADDLGYGDLSCYGSDSIRTPVLDQLARQGVRLTNFYAGCTVCTPSRMALLTGSYPARVGWRGGVVGYGIKTFNGLAPEVTTLAERFQTAGYKTALIGKWHLGDSAELSPQQQGFETTFYLNKSNNQTKQLWQGNTLVADPFDNRLLTEQFADQAIGFITQHRQQPFFLYLPLTAPHFPAQSHPQWKGKSKRDAYGDVVEELDHRVGQLLETLERNALSERTIVVFLSDNGVEPGQKQWASAKPYRGLKWSALEGGNRVPCIIRWPGKIPPNQTSDLLSAAIDLFPTLARACDIELPANPNASTRIDGVDLLPALTKQNGKQTPRSWLLLWHGWGTLQAIRTGRWKLYVDEVKEIPQSNKGPVLIDLDNDPKEQTDVSKQHPEQVAAMLAEAQKQLADIQASEQTLGGRDLAKIRVPTPPKWLPSNH